VNVGAVVPSTKSILTLVGSLDAGVLWKDWGLPTAVMAELNVLTTDIILPTDEIVAVKADFLVSSAACCGRRTLSVKFFARDLISMPAPAFSVLTISTIKPYPEILSD
jgi:hypothetical protein